MNLYIAWVYLEEVFCEGDLFGLPCIYVMLLFLLYFGNAGVVLDDLFDSH
jgi:hypothetical protein